MNCESRCLCVKKAPISQFCHGTLLTCTSSACSPPQINSTEELALGLKTFQGGGGDDDDDDDHAAFPTLEKALKTINPHGGFNIEIKWDMELKVSSQGI